MNLGIIVAWYGRNHVTRPLIDQLLTIREACADSGHCAIPILATNHPRNTTFHEILIPPPHHAARMRAIALDRAKTLQTHAVMHHDSDDWHCPTAIAESLERLENYPDIGFTYRSEVMRYDVRFQQGRIEKQDRPWPSNVIIRIEHATRLPFPDSGMGDATGTWLRQSTEGVDGFRFDGEAAVFFAHGGNNGVRNRCIDGKPIDLPPGSRPMYQALRASPDIGPDAKHPTNPTGGAIDTSGASQS